MQKGTGRLETCRQREEGLAAVRLWVADHGPVAAGWGRGVMICAELSGALLANTYSRACGSWMATNSRRAQLLQSKIDILGVAMHTRRAGRM